MAAAPCSETEWGRVLRLNTREAARHRVRVVSRSPMMYACGYGGRGIGGNHTLEGSEGRVLPKRSIQELVAAPWSARPPPPGMAADPPPIPAPYVRPVVELLSVKASSRSVDRPSTWRTCCRCSAASDSATRWLRGPVLSSSTLSAASMRSTVAYGTATRWPGRSVNGLSSTDAARASCDAPRLSDRKALTSQGAAIFRGVSVMQCQRWAGRARDTASPAWLSVFDRRA